MLKTHCKHGHPFDEANTYVTKRGTRACRACQRARGRRTKSSPERLERMRNYAQERRQDASVRSRQAEYNRKPEVRARMNQSTARSRKEKRIWLASEKLRRGCHDCGYRMHPDALQFDHLQGEKSFDLSMVSNSYERLAAEIEKCQVVCANCHAIRTALRREGKL